MSAVPEPELRYPKSVMCRRNHPGRRPVGTGTTYSIRPTSSGQAIGVLKASAGKLLTVGSDPWGSATGTVRDEGTKRPTSGGSHDPWSRTAVTWWRVAGWPVQAATSNTRATPPAHSHRCLTGMPPHSDLAVLSPGETHPHG